MTGDGDVDQGAITRRHALVAGTAGLAAIAVAGIAASATGLAPAPGRLRRMFDGTGPDGVVPDAPQSVRLEQRWSRHRNQDVGFFTAVPSGWSGAQLPVCLVLHGASATTADFEEFGLGRFLTDAMRRGVPPFVLAGADGGRSFWLGNGENDDPQRMLREELPVWCAERGFDATRMAAYGWSMGGHGVLVAAERNPSWLRATATLSPAVSPGDAAFEDVDRLDGARTAVWCGSGDALYDNVRSFASMIPGGPAVAAYAPGAHTRGYWNRVTPDAFAFIGSSLSRRR